MQSALVSLLRQWLSQHRSGLYALAAAMLVAYLFYRPQPPPAGNAGGECSATQRPPKLKAKPRVTLSTAPGVLFARLPTDGTVELTAGALNALARLAAWADVYLITSCVPSDEAETAVRAALVSAGVLSVPGIDARRILICSTKMGCSAMCRQIEPVLHIESSAEVVEALAPHLPHVALVGAVAPPAASSRNNVLIATSLTELTDLYLAGIAT
jgi:hypothetical protein